MAILVEGAGHKGVNGLYKLSGEHNGRPTYRHITNDSMTINWDPTYGGFWKFHELGIGSPYSVTQTSQAKEPPSSGWEKYMSNGKLPAPTLRAIDESSSEMEDRGRCLQNLEDSVTTGELDDADELLQRARACSESETTHCPHHITTGNSANTRAVLLSAKGENEDAEMLSATHEDKVPRPPPP